MYIGTLSQRTGASPKALRLYESIGLLAGVRRQGVYRVYGEPHVEQVALIRQALALGFRLAELPPVLNGPGGTPDWAALQERLGRKRQELRRSIRRLQSLERQLSDVEAELRHCSIAGRDLSLADCRLPRA